MTSEARIDKTPFTVYDITGYLAPGFLATYAVHIFVLNHPTLGPLYRELDFHNFLVMGANNYSFVFAAIIYLIVSYTVGQIISFLSSLTVEKMAVYYLDYPSKHLVRHFQHTGPFCERTIIKNLSQIRGHLRAKIVHIICLPLVPVIAVCFFLGLFSAVLKKLPRSICEMVHEKFKQRSKGNIDDSLTENWFIFVSYYIINNNQRAWLRAYNYLTMYGFLRAMCFLAICVFWIVAGYAVWFWWVTGTSSYLHWVYLALAIVIASLLFLAFIKFYRRYSEEILMAFVTAEDMPN